MGRTLGPFTDVSTARVDGAYEIYQGEDAEGREVEILTLGVTSSKDPSRRALLSDTVAWAHATRGPADAPILSADLSAEQPYVVTLRQTGFRGVERMMERMLAMGPPTGPLLAPTGTHTGQIPAVGYHTNPHGIPRVTSAPPSGSPVTPASPMTSYVTRAQRSRPPWLVPLVVVLALLILASGGFLIFIGMTDDKDAAAGSYGDSSSAPDQSASEPTPTSDLTSPQWRDDVNVTPLDNVTPLGQDEGSEITEPGWAFAFKVLNGMECEIDQTREAQCDGELGGDRVEVVVSVTDCPQDCPRGDREVLSQEWWDGQNASPQYLDSDTSVAVIDENGQQVISFSRFYSPSFNGENFSDVVQVTVRASGPQNNDAAMQLVNDVYTQTR